jgi:hypothetical protein
MHANAQRLLNHLPATRTALAGVARVNRYHLTASLFRFARQGQYKLTPRRVSNRLRKTVVFEHVRDAQVFDGDHPEAVNQLAGRLVREVAATEADPLVNTRNRLPSSRPFGGALLLLGELCNL